LGELGEVVPGLAPVLLLTGWALASAAARNADEGSKKTAPTLAADTSQPAHEA
jgi:hypothetical protein